MITFPFESIEAVCLDLGQLFHKAVNDLLNSPAHLIVQFSLE